MNGVIFMGKKLLEILGCAICCLALLCGCSSGHGTFSVDADSDFEKSPYVNQQALGQIEPTKKPSATKKPAAKKSASSKKSSSAKTPAINFAAGEKINLNTATAGQLVQLSGIGEVTAQKILNYRQAHGPFINVLQLLEVDGIGDKTFEGIKDFVYVENPQPMPEKTQKPEKTQTPQAEAAPEPEPEQEQLEPEAEPEPEPEAPSHKNADGLLNINQATKEELMEIDGIGEVLAQRILDFIAVNGPVSDLDELLKVNGIGEKKLEKIKEVAIAE